MTSLKLQVNKAIWQRVDMRFHLQALTREETAAYIAKHLATVKAPGEIFTHAACLLFNHELMNIFYHDFVQRALKI